MVEVADTTVFVVHGRNRTARDGMFEFLRSLGLRPLEWSQALQLTGTGSPYIGEVLDHAFSAAQAVVVLMTPDEIAYLQLDYASNRDDPEHAPSAQARPNVLFEAGMAFTRTVLDVYGHLYEGVDEAAMEGLDRLRSEAQTDAERTLDGSNVMSMHTEPRDRQSV
ncbi:MAG: nucleotide-binding protein [Acidimicrobiia bacterium]